MGGDGVTRFYPLERMMRDAKIREVTAGTSDIQRLIIYRWGIRDWEEDLKAPRRVLHKELNIPIPAAEGELPSYAASADGVLQALADNYRVNPGLYVTVGEIMEQVPAAEDGIIGFLCAEIARNLTRSC